MSALTHFIGFIAVIPVFICLLEKAETKLQMIGFIVFGISLMLLYGASTIYHTLKLSAERTALLRRIDHMMIFVLIAGTYTPVCLVTLAGKFGTILLSAIWVIAVAGVFMKIFWMGAPRWLSTMIYVVMGWLSITAFVP
ncbi:MAG: hemolysin III family protein, partial [Anaerotignum sp.]|nr:hemolysin III family protein [Anaerotignum sp.]